uniref:NADH-ubiquinone oxidoreductase chain 4 n=1 Tax=Laternula truncata TaxID=1199070 RepID=A0A1U9XPK8_9BIVA|nr:NADH dehydrogenase subunit 4 [Laternula truncata]AQZ26185.1 NADH dehydrogenase subunit 4 [Laternula truncata]
MLGLQVVVLTLAVTCGVSLFLQSAPKCFMVSVMSFLGLICPFSVAHYYQSSLSMVAVSGSLVKDSVGSSLICLTLWVLFLCFYSSMNKVSNISRFSAALLLSGLILVLFFSVGYMSLFYFFFEISVVPMVYIILGWGYQPERVQASNYMLIYTVAASLPLLAFIVHSYWKWGSLYFLLVNMSDMSMWSLAILLAFLVKLPVFFVHLWLPKAHSEAPVAGSMLLAGVLLKLGGFGLMRSLVWWGFSIRGLMPEAIVVFSLCGGVVTSFICLRQTDIKALVAYSSIGHMSLIVAGLMSGTQAGWISSAWIMIAHGLCSSGLFALVNDTYSKWGSRSVYLVKGGLSVMPSMSMWWFLLCTANMACPPTLNLVSEITLFCSAVYFHCWMFIPGCLMIFLTAGYSLFLYAATQHGSLPASVGTFAKPSCDGLSTGMLHWVPLNVLTLGCGSLC